MRQTWFESIRQETVCISIIECQYIKEQHGILTLPLSCKQFATDYRDFARFLQQLCSLIVESLCNVVVPGYVLRILGLAQEHSEVRGDRECRNIGRHGILW